MTVETGQRSSSNKKKEKWSKNKKKNWRKKIDISKIEEGLDLQRLELRTGGIIADKSNDELFKIETRQNLETNEQKQLPIKYRRLTADKILVPDPHKVQPNSRRIGKKKRQVQRKKLLQLLAVSQKQSIQKAPPKSNASHDYDGLDIWNKDVIDLNHEIHKRSDVNIHTLSVVGQKGLKRPEHMFRRPIFDKHGLEVAHPGSSYNPSLDVHQSLLYEETLKEVNKERKSANIERAIYVDPKTFATVASRRQEELEGLLHDDDDSDDEEEKSSVSSNDEDGQKGNLVKEKRKTKKARRIAKELKLEKQQKEIEWAKKLRENEVYQSKTFLKEIKKKEKESLKRQAKKKEFIKRPVLSSYKFVEPNQDLQLSHEMRGSLRALKPEGDILTDCYKSLQKRCIIEPRQKFKPPKRKYKVRYQERREFREIEL